MTNNHMTRCLILLGKCKLKHHWSTFSYITPIKVNKVFIYEVDKNAENKHTPCDRSVDYYNFCGNYPVSIY